VTNENVSDLYDRVRIGTPVVVLAPHTWRLAGPPG
jgi:lipoprotein-anchoring transpeptidase ErfK/SrfK